ncbi:phosphoribosylglycinamide synthetase C domain-containing protein [Crystallibacter crystallopoietes]|uniref:phosphoribosylglycinamide synthetase C domain-containing protein n=1 Tax=Crystallibacter crystallopoietes TaxID=37928 RepID=UPI001ED9AE59|nr:phosphoribosylglycinamide synthetase C domain-containing protein [Arthrobacter crystallopoietes]
MRGLNKANALDGVHVIHAGTKLDDNRKVVSSGGRVLAVVALGEDLVDAREKAYEGVELIHLDGSQHRSDIALKAANGGISIPAQRSRTETAKEQA